MPVRTEPDRSTTIVNVPSGVGDVDGVISAYSGNRLLGFAIKESAATPAAASVVLVHGATVVGGTVIEGFEFDLGPDGSVVYWFGPDGIDIPNGLSVDRVSGATKLTFFYKRLG